MTACSPRQKKAGILSVSGSSNKTKAAALRRMATVQQTVFTESAGSAPLTPYAAAFVFISVRENLLLLQAVIQ
jgi:hypothetical protein